MRNRFFLINLLILLTVAVGSVFLYSFFLKNERLAFIDRQVRETAATLVDSELGDLRKINFEQADDIISEELGESRIGKFFIIRDGKGDIVYESNSVQLLPVMEIPRDQQWLNIITPNKFIRVLNLNLPRIHNRTMQVGLVLDKDLVYLDYFSNSTLFFAVVIFLLGLVTSFLSTTILLQPVARLAKFLEQTLNISQTQQLLPALPKDIRPSLTEPSKDEFIRVVDGLNHLIQQVNKNFSFSRQWSYQMAHELKTPLSVIQLEIEKIQKDKSLGPDEVKPVLTGIFKVTETINSFLGWAELENNRQKKNLFMVSLNDVIQNFINENIHLKEMVKLQLQQTIHLPAVPHHIEQLVQNLIYNAVKYSKESPEVIVRISDSKLEIQDAGPGMPAEVLERLGDPFNRGSQNPRSIPGHGLGLAWVTSICRRYEWKLEFINTRPGTLARITFNSMSPE